MIGCPKCAETSAGNCGQHALDNHGYAIPSRRPYRCPTCDGTGLVSWPPGVAGDQPTWSDNATGPFPCQPGGGTRIVWGVCPSSTSTHLQEDTQSMGWLPAAIRIVPIIWQAVMTVERLIKDRKGKDKQDEAVRMTGELLALIEGAVGRDLLNDASVQAAVRNAIDAIVALQNTIRNIKGVKPS